MLNFWQRARLIIETKTYLSLLLSGILWGLAIAFFATYNHLFLYALVCTAYTTVVGLLAISRITDDWWYHKYDNNEWGHGRRHIQELEDTIQIVKDIRKELK